MRWPEPPEPHLQGTENKNRNKGHIVMVCRFILYR